MSLKLHQSAYEYAQKLIQDRRCVLDQRRDWTDHKPARSAARKFIETHGPFCRAVASRAAPAGDKDICFVEEREARDQLVQQWSRFDPADRIYCERLATTGGDPTYTELLTCLELQRDARNLREKQEGTTAISPRSR
jgi:hypothetical protein